MVFQKNEREEHIYQLKLGRKMKLFDDTFDTLLLYEETKEQKRLITNKDLLNASSLNEIEHTNVNFK